MKRDINPVFRAISDPTRRRILDLLAESEQSVKELTAKFGISQPAISQHLRELRESRLVRAERVGVEQRYSLTPAPLADVFQWVSRYRMLFDTAGHAWAMVATQGRKRDGD